MFLVCLLVALAAARDASLSDLRAHLDAATKRAVVTKAAVKIANAQAHASILGKKRGVVVCPDGGDASIDTDKDGHPDCVDACPTDFRKTRPGACGCNVSDRDSDGDGHADCVDVCKNDAKKVVPGVCGCGLSDNGCGCNVDAVVSGSCARTVASADPSFGADYALFGPDGSIVARVELPAGALSLSVHESLEFALGEPIKSNVHGDAERLSSALTMAIVGGHATPLHLHQAGRVCLAGPMSAEHAKSMCLGFADPLSNGDLKCFEPSLEWDAKHKMACGRVSSLTTVQLIRTSRHTSIQPYVVSVDPSSLPANGRLAFRISGGNFHRGTLQRLAIGGNPLALSECKVEERLISCRSAPAGRGEALDLELDFTSQKASDMLFHIKVPKAFSYQHGAIFAVEYRGDARLEVRGEHFGPVGALHMHAVQVDGKPCTDPRVEMFDTVLSCIAPQQRKRDDHAPQVSLRMHEHAHPVHSTATHFVRMCDAVHEFRCQDGGCVDKEEFCPMCMSGWSMCPLSMPSLIHGECVSTHHHIDAQPTSFDVTLDGSVGFSLPIGAHGTISAQAGAGPTKGKHCLSAAMPVAEEGFESHVYNVSVAHDWHGMARLDVHSPAVSEAGDPYGFCMARWNCDTARWECVDETLCMGAAPGFVSGDVPVHAGENLYAVIRDNCPHDANPTQLDSDHNGVGDACEAAAGLVESCRDRTMGNIKYIQKIISTTHYNVEEQPCPYATSHPAVCDIHGDIFLSHVAEWAGPARSLPLKAPYPSAEKGGRKPFPNRKGIHESRPKPTGP